MATCENCSKEFNRGNSRTKRFCSPECRLEGMAKALEAVKGLKSAAGFIRRELGLRLSIRHVPTLIFKATDSIEYSANISRILNNLDIKREDDEENE